MICTKCNEDRKIKAKQLCHRCYDNIRYKKLHTNVIKEKHIRASIVPTCHPDSKHQAHGLCGVCYRKKRYKELMEKDPDYCKRGYKRKVELHPELIKRKPTIEVLKKKYYLLDKDLYKEVIVSKATGKPSRELIRMLMLIGKNIIRKMNYKNPMDREDSLQYAYERLYMNWYNFDEERYDSPFNYYSEISKRSIAFQWNQLYKNKVNTVSIYGNDEGVEYLRENI